MKDHPIFIGPVTAVHVTNSLLLVAQGGCIRVYNLLPSQSSFRCQHTRKIFKHGPIHGITSVEVDRGFSALLVWGGRSACILVVKPLNVTIDSETIHRTDGALAQGATALQCEGDLSERWQEPRYNIKVGKIFKVTDRIQCGVFRPPEEALHLEAVVVTAHSAVYRIIVPIVDLLMEPMIGETSRLEHLSSGSKSLLFAAKARWLTRELLLLASGTAFGELIVSVIDFSSDNKEHAIRRTAIVDAAHEGAIFDLDICFSRDSVRPEEVWIATCSDDRTLRLWDATCVLSGSDLTLTPVQRSIERLAWTWAHLSRIWNVAFGSHNTVATGTGHEYFLISAGEDATTQVWKSNLFSDRSEKHDQQGLIEHVSVLPEHAGKNIWALAIEQHSSNTLHVVTGGADGAVELTRLSANPASEENIDFDVKQLRLSSDFFNHGSFRNFSWINNFSLLVIISTGDVWHATISEGSPDSTSWHHVAKLESIAGYSVLCGIVSLEVVLIGASDGTVYIFRNASLSLHPLARVEGKVFGIVSGNTHDRDARTRVSACVVTTLRSERATLLSSDDGPWSRIWQNTLVLRNSAPVTSLKVIHTYDNCQYVFIGARDGCVSLYQIWMESDEMLTFNIQRHPTAFIEAHQDAITSITWLVRCFADDTHNYILTTSRDSSYAIHAVELQGEALAALEVHRGHPPLGPLIEGAIINAVNGDLILYGFRGNDFVVYDETVRRESASINCKGGHRLWSYEYASDLRSESHVGSFAWNTAGSLNVVRLQQVQHTTIRAGGHGREIKASAICPVPYNRDTSSRLIATGAEDTDIYVFEYSLHFVNGPFRHLMTIRKHNTGIQQLRWSSNGRYLFSCGGSEELFIWRISNVPVVEVGVVCLASLPRYEAETPDLRITSFDVMEERMDGGSGVMLKIVVALSDSTLRVYEYNERSSVMPFTLISRARYTSCCLMQVGHFESIQGVSILAAATDGTLVMWQMPDARQAPASSDLAAPHQLHLTWQKRIHQNTVKSLLVIALPARPDAYSADMKLVITAGDDNALAFTLLSTSSQLRNAPLKTASKGQTHTLLVPRAHAASITAVELISGPIIKKQKVSLRIASVSNDQRIRLWDLSIPFNDNNGGYDMDTIEVRRASRIYTEVADVAELTLIGRPNQYETEGDSRELLAVGVGMEVLLVECKIY